MSEPLPPPPERDRLYARGVRRSAQSEQEGGMGHGEDSDLPDVIRLLVRSVQLTPAATLPDRKIGSYSLGEELGRGATGIVYRAVHEQLGRQFAVKVIP